MYISVNLVTLVTSYSHKTASKKLAYFLRYYLMSHQLLRDLFFCFFLLYNYFVLLHLSSLQVLTLSYYFLNFSFESFSDIIL